MVLFMNCSELSITTMRHLSGWLEVSTYQAPHPLSAPQNRLHSNSVPAVAVQSTI